MTPETRAKLAALGTELTPTLLQTTTKLIASLSAPKDDSVSITRDHQTAPMRAIASTSTARGNPRARPCWSMCTAAAS